MNPGMSAAALPAPAGQDEAPKSNATPTLASALPALSRSRLPGEQKALLFLLSLDEGLATRVLSHLHADEVAQLRKASKSMEEVDLNELLSIHREFIDVVQRGVPTSLKGSDAYLRRLAGKALGEGKAMELWEDRPPPRGPVAAMSSLDLPTLTALLEREHPQTLAVILSQFDIQRAGQILAEFPLDMQADIVRRMARLESIDEEVIEEIERQFATELAALGSLRRRRIQGVDAASAILKRLKSDATSSLLQEVQAIDPDMATALQNSLFTFEDLIRIDGRGIQMLLKEITTDQLVVALKSASEELKQKVFGNLSTRAATMLRDEMEMLGPVRLSEVEEARRTIVDAALRLERDGRIFIAREGGDAYA